MLPLPQKSEGLLLLDNIQISQHLEKYPEMEMQAIRLRTCGKNFNFFMCNCNFIKIPKRCNYRICPVCGKIRSIKFYKKFIGLIKKKRVARSIYDKGLRLLTLTIKNQENLEGGITKLYSSFTQLKRRDYCKHNLSGGLGVIEIKKGKDGLWNHHIHFIIDSSYLDMKSHKKTGKDAKLVQEWKECTGDSGILDIKRITYHKGALNYVLKYLTKGIDDLTNEEKALFFKLTFKRRLLFTFGKEFYGIKFFKEKHVCPECGGYYKYLLSNSEEYEIAKNYFKGKPPTKDLFYGG
jgi:plasmid rolling circle replication initiator protein Rep